MQIRVFTVDENGFINIRPEEFELLLNDAYTEGYSQNSLTIGFQEPKESSKDAVYPTWWEWLFSIGAVTRKVRPDVASILIETGLLDPIPADIAEKFDIKLKKNI